MSDRFFRQSFSFAAFSHDPDQLAKGGLSLQNSNPVTVDSDERRSRPSTFERSPLDPSAPSESWKVAETLAAPCIKSESPRLARLKPAQAAMKVERVAPNLTLGDRPRFLLIHFESGLQIPEPFTQQECEVIRNVIQCWHWMVDLKSREPSGRAYLLDLLEEICDQPAIFGGVAS
ncbi:hypothetical protein NDI44_22410 [Trichocoleus sp. DQ-A3]|uniref:hypothetical protein n=1 Tax=Cyanophyceae TaxID=3028117 RepID=UPI001687A80C|nr:hypothetical protein [Coleofasciculus sp. FACHB-125]MBD1903791.1 hypothetical protein [Coleofasciculus sp. FACHB-125]